MDEASGVAAKPAEQWRSFDSYLAANNPAPPRAPRQPRSLKRRSRVKVLTVLLILVLPATAWSSLKPAETYRFIHVQADGKTPVAYSPCRPIRYVVQRQGEPAGGGEAITAAIARVSQATGLPFAYDGDTSEAFSRQREAYQPAKYGHRWAPVLIAWVSRAQDPTLQADALGAGGSASVEVPDGKRAYVSGRIELNIEQLAQMMQEANGKQEVQAVVMHELGHVVGLTHVNSRKELMNPSHVSGMNTFGAGDLTGLAALGKGTCSTNL